MADSAILASHEDRLQVAEMFRAEVSATMAALTEQLKGVGEKVEEAATTLRKDIADLKQESASNHASLRQEFDALRREQSQQADNVKLLLSDRQAREKRLKTAKGLGSATFIAILGGVATQWGESIWKWLTVFFSSNRGH